MRQAELVRTTVPASEASSTVACDVSSGLLYLTFFVAIDRRNNPIDCLTVNAFWHKLSVYFHNTMLPILKRALENTGLSDKQTAVLGVLLENGGSMLVASIARAAKLNRTTVYDILNELVDKGLASKVKKEGAFRYQSIAPESLPSYVERRRDALEESKRELAELVPQIKLMQSKGRALPKVQFFEGQEGMQQAYEDVLVNNNEKFLRGITGMDAVYANFDIAWVEYFLRRAASEARPMTKSIFERQNSFHRNITSRVILVFTITRSRLFHTREKIPSLSLLRTTQSRR